MKTNKYEICLESLKEIDPNPSECNESLPTAHAIGSKHSPFLHQDAPVIMVDAEVRVMASELLHQETDSEIKTLLQELMVDESLEGTEAEKNAFALPRKSKEMRVPFQLSNRKATPPENKAKESVKFPI